MDAIRQKFTLPDLYSLYEASRRAFSGPVRTPADFGAAPAANETGVDGSQVQQGIQPAGYREEFRPYSRSGQDGAGLISGSGEKYGKISGVVDRTASVGGETPAGSSGAQDPGVEAEVARLKSIEEKVKAHEAAHKAAGGAMTGPVSYTYTRGPDGRSYVTGGEVPINVSPGKTPQETVRRMQQVIRAALAPADPSPQDRAVAARAAVQQQEASREIAVAPAPGVTGDAEVDNADPSVVSASRQAYAGNKGGASREKIPGRPLPASMITPDISPRSGISRRISRYV